MCSPFYYSESDIDRAVKAALDPIREVYEKYKEFKISAFDNDFKDNLERMRFDCWQAIKKAMEGK